jgi:hypothetical protein
LQRNKAKETARHAVSKKASWSSFAVRNKDDIFSQQRSYQYCKHLVCTFHSGSGWPWLA